MGWLASQCHALRGWHAVHAAPAQQPRSSLQSGGYSAASRRQQQQQQRQQLQARRAYA